MHCQLIQGFDHWCGYWEKKASKLNNTLRNAFPSAQAHIKPNISAPRLLAITTPILVVSYCTQHVPIPPVRRQAVQGIVFVCSVVPSATFCLLVSICTVEPMGFCTITKSGNRTLWCYWNMPFGQTDFLLLICGIWTGCWSCSLTEEN